MHIEKDNHIDPANETNIELAAGEATCGFIDDETVANTLPKFNEAEHTNQTKIIVKKLELLKPGNKCYPYGVTIHSKTQFIFYNLFEALQNLPEETQEEIQKLWLAAIERTDMAKYKLDRIRIFKKLDQAIREYWASEAEMQAEELLTHK